MNRIIFDVRLEKAAGNSEQKWMDDAKEKLEDNLWAMYIGLNYV